MKKVKIFYLENCPHCRRAFKMLDELQSKNPKYSATFYVDGVKLHEGVPTMEKIEEVLKKAVL